MTNSAVKGMILGGAWGLFVAAVVCPVFGLNVWEGLIPLLIGSTLLATYIHKEPNKA